MLLHKLILNWLNWIDTHTCLVKYYLLNKKNRLIQMKRSRIPQTRPFSYWHNHRLKLRKLGLQNLIVDNSHFKTSKFKHWIWSDSKSDIKILFRFKGDDKIRLMLTNFWLKCWNLFDFCSFSVDFDQFLIKISKKTT